MLCLACGFREQLGPYTCVWDPPTAKNISAVEMVQRRAARFVTGEYRRTSSVSALLRP